ncbi:MAG TPA: hypothetical protein VMV41_07450 [Cellulomonadaceae bacterium]|nr:hypothetical protein [Cellulomonadaceae bacterium]
MSTDVTLPSDRSVTAQAAFIGQATAIEQARAVAEVQAAVVVAQQVPRDMARAIGEMRDSCGRMSLAKRAFYTVPNRGNGPSVHLARELARIWGNIQFGVHELRRDDDAGESEVQAFAWDVQANTRSTRTFIAPHARMKTVAGKKTREALVDLGDIYLSNQNTGARAVRECIFTVLPTWFTEEAQDVCRSTIENGEGVPLEQRITNMIGAFATIRISVEQLETKTGRRRGQWTAGDVADLTIAYTSVTRDGLDKDEVFPPKRVTVDEIKPAARGRQAPEPAAVVEDPPAGFEDEAEWPPVASVGGER